MASLGALLSVFFQGFVAKRTQEGPRGGQEASWARFSMVLDRFWEGFGTSLASLVALLSVFFSRLCCQEGSRGSKRQPRGLLGSIWDGFGEVLGGQNNEKIDIFDVFFICFSRFCVGRVLFDF